MDTIVLITLIAAACLSGGFFIGLIIGKGRRDEPPIGTLVVGTDGEDYVMRLDIDRNVTGVNAEDYIMARDYVTLDVNAIRIR